MRVGEGWAPAGWWKAIAAPSKRCRKSFFISQSPAKTEVCVFLILGLSVSKEVDIFKFFCEILNFKLKGLFYGDL